MAGGTLVISSGEKVSVSWIITAWLLLSAKPDPTRSNYITSRRADYGSPEALQQWAIRVGQK